MKIVAISATDANTSGTIFKQSMMIDMPVRIANTQGFSDEDGLFAIGWDFLGTLVVWSVHGRLVERSGGQPNHCGAGGDGERTEYRSAGRPVDA